MKITSTVTGKDRQSIAINLRLLADEVEKGTVDNAGGHFGRDGSFDFDIEEDQAGG